MREKKLKNTTNIEDICSVNELNFWAIREYKERKTCKFLMVAPSVEQQLELNYASQTTTMRKIFEEFTLLKAILNLKIIKACLRNFICSAQVDILCVY